MNEIQVWSIGRTILTGVNRSPRTES